MCLMHEQLNQGVVTHFVVETVQARTSTVIGRVHLGDDDPLIPSQVCKVYGQIVNLAFSGVVGMF